MLKGGVNLRYFFGSLRYSEDIDLDVNGVEPWGLEDKVDGVLGSGAMLALLRIGGLGIAELSKPKQTKTTRRWKVALEVWGRSDLVRTEIEFSNRNGEQRYLLEAVPSRIVAPYALRSPSVQHYTEDAADRALQLPFAAFRDQVLPFLDPGVVELYDTEGLGSKCRPSLRKSWRKRNEDDPRLRRPPPT